MDTELTNSVSVEPEVLEEAVLADVSPIVHFDVWFAMREKRLPVQHMKEIILADFCGRGLSKIEQLSKFDEALSLYGVKL